MSKQIESINSSNESALEEQDDAQYLESLLDWQVDEYPNYQRSKTWYLSFGAISLLLIIISVVPVPWPRFIGSYLPTENFTFAILIVLVAVVLVAFNYNEPKKIDVILTAEGIFVGREFFNYDLFKQFSVIVLAGERIKVLYLEFINTVRPRLSIKLNDVDPIEVRKILLDYLEEDLDRTDETNTDYFSRLFKI